METNDQLEQMKESTPPPASSMEKQPPKEPGKVNLFFKRLLRRSVLWLGVLALGVVLTWVVQVKPRLDDIKALQTEVSNLEDEAGALAVDLARLEGIENERDSLQLQLDDTRNHLVLLDILVDVSTAQLAINNDNFDTARAALAETDTKMAELAAGLESDYLETIEGMRSRLKLALDGIDQDAFAAESDLEVLRNSILALERSLFGD